MNKVTKFKVGDVVKNGRGSNIRIVDINYQGCGGLYPVVGIGKNQEGTEECYQYTADGIFDVNYKGDDPVNLVLPKKPTVTLFAYLSNDGQLVHFVSTKTVNEKYFDRVPGFDLEGDAP